ncbi:MAG: AI-2E family transporter [Arthrobacter sp.]
MGSPETTTPWSDSLGRASIRTAQVLLMLVLSVLVVYGLIQVKLLVIPGLLALILAAAIAPFVQWLRRRGWPSTAATTVSFVVLLLAFGAVITGIVFAVMNQASELGSKASEGFDRVYAFIRTGPIHVDEQQIRQARDAVVDFATSSNVGAGALSGLSAAGNFITGALLMAVILFFFLKDGESIWAFVLRAFKGKNLVKARRAGERGLTVLGGYVRGTSIVAFVDAFFIGLALVIMGVPLALPLAALTFIGAFIPLIGATLAGVLAALVALVANGPFAALVVVIVVIVVNQLEGNFLQPVVMGQALNVHALVILLALTAGTILAGIIGAILAVPLVAVAWAAIKAWNTTDDITPQAIAEAEHETRLNEKGEGVRSTPRHTRTPQEEHSGTADTDASPERRF